MTNYEFGKNPEIASPEALNNLYAGVDRFAREQPQHFTDMSLPSRFLPPFEGLEVRDESDEAPHRSVEFSGETIARALPEVAIPLDIDESSKVFIGYSGTSLVRIHDRPEGEEPQASDFRQADQICEFVVEQHAPAQTTESGFLVAPQLKEVVSYTIMRDPENPQKTTGQFERAKSAAESLITDSNQAATILENELDSHGEIAMGFAMGDDYTRVTAEQANAWQALLDHINIPGA